jgi:excisionase family DNA binding protein
MPPTHPRLAYTRHEVAEMLGISEPTIDRLVKRGLLKPIRATRRPLFSLPELERFLSHASPDSPQPTQRNK